MMHHSALPPVLERLQPKALRVGAGALLLCLLGAIFHPAAFFQAYLFAFLVWVSLPLGCLAIFMLHHLVRGAWGVLLLRFIEAGARTMPLMAALFLPLLFGLSTLYPWARPDVLAHDALLQHKAPYLNVPFFVFRALLYFAVWSGLALVFTGWSRQHDQDPDAPLARLLRQRLRLASGPGLVAYALTMTFASVDWAMSLEPHWYSTIYGVIFMVGQVQLTLASAIMLLRVLGDEEPFASLVVPAHYHDLGNLLLAFVMLWAYMSFAQFFIIWSANLPEELPWYLHRTQGGWEVLAMFLVFLRFALPFLVLLSRGNKRRLQTLALIAGTLMAMHVVELFWVVMPAFYPKAFHLHWQDLLAPIGVGGLWMASFIRNLRGHPLLPVNDPRLHRKVAHE